MNIYPIQAIQEAYRRAAGLNPLADTQDVLEAVGAEFGLPPEAVANAIEMPNPVREVHHTFGEALAAALNDQEAAIHATAQHLALPVTAVRGVITRGEAA